MFTFMSKEKIELIHDYAVRSHIESLDNLFICKFLDSLIMELSHLLDSLF